MAAEDLVFVPLSRAPTPADDIWFQHACLRLLQGDVAEYQGRCRNALKQIGQTREGFTGTQAFLASRACMLHPQMDHAQGLLWADKAVSSDPKCPWYLHVLALAHYRPGQWDKAIEQCLCSL